ncbi:TetR/AcrR family transcriptional regulator [Tomitella fengzijianii]|uniref:TetR/AcrR family transcriptional regulator n=1 Tax=Tomitella fengzijianii TaxID=2597660 RepID=A0A516X0I2_9ACTN|nr:TetR/AcrR family transcriptional regulator [Tomitella fengzijianii]QDQ96563.1 TetR/AcrR family transcriptional regulator [Tomitella fengzijianii]
MTEEPPTGAERPDGRATRWAGHKAERRELILTAAVEVIGESAEDVGVQAIARRAGIPRSVVYRHFSGRGDLDEQIRERIIGMLLETISPTLTPRGTVREAIDDAVSAYLRWIVESPRLHQFLGVGSASHRTVGSRVVTGTKTAIAVRLSDLIAGVLEGLGKPTDIAETLAFGVTGLVDSAVNRWLGNPASTLTIDRLGEFLRVAIWQVLDGTMREAGVAIDPDAPVSELAPTA